MPCIPDTFALPRSTAVECSPMFHPPPYVYAMRPGRNRMSHGAREIQCESGKRIQEALEGIECHVGRGKSIGRVGNVREIVQYEIDSYI